jgi:mRNA-degrading endonuclease toxin of MazEF toxin-antitoxin module
MVSVVNLDNILTVPRGRLVKRMGVCDTGKLDELGQAIRVAFDLVD